MKSIAKNIHLSYTFAILFISYTEKVYTFVTLLLYFSYTFLTLFLHFCYTFLKSIFCYTFLKSIFCYTFHKLYGKTIYNPPEPSPAPVHQN
jgi:hypothetical protein